MYANSNKRVSNFLVDITNVTYKFEFYLRSMLDYLLEKAKNLLSELERSVGGLNLVSFNAF